VSDATATNVKTERLFNKNFFLLWQGQFVSNIGTQLFLVVTMLWIENVTGSATLMGTIGAMTGIIMVLLGPFGGTFADRHSRKRIIVLTDLLNGLSVTALAIMAFVFPEQIKMLIIALFAVSGFNAVLSSFFSPAVGAAIPDIVPKKELASANSYAQFNSQFSSILGMGVAGFLFTQFGAAIIFLINGLSYLFSAFSELFIKIPQTLPEKSLTKDESHNEFKKDLVQGFGYIWQQKGLKSLVLVYAFLGFFTAPLLVLMPFFVEDYMQLGEEWYGYIMAVYSGAAVLGYLLAALLKLEKEQRAKGMILCFILEAISFILFSMLRSHWAVMAIAVFGGAVGGFISVNVITLIQATTPSKIRGRVFGVISTIAGSIAPIGMALSGIVADLIDHNVPLIFLACGVGMLFITIIAASIVDFRKFLATDTSGTEDVETEAEAEAFA
jgi:MFS transporter, DHA3 family, macrolide efflux protein